MASTETAALAISLPDGSVPGEFGVSIGARPWGDARERGVA